MQGQSKDAFPSDTTKNPRDCMAVQLRSGKELESRKSVNVEKEKEMGGSENTVEKNEEKCKISSMMRTERKRIKTKYRHTCPMFHFLRGYRR